jgi:lipid A disaccharide synthetase
LIQDDFSVINLREELNSLLSDVGYRQEIQAGYGLVRERIGEQQASVQVAHFILEATGKKINPEVVGV